MNISAGLSSPTIEGRIILTAENNMAAGFDDARKELQAFAREFSRVQATLNAQINTSQRGQTQAARQQVRDAARVNNLIGSMFKQFVAGATSAFTALTIMGDRYDQIFKTNIESSIRISRTLAATTRVSEAGFFKAVDELVRKYNLPNVQRAREQAVPIQGRVDTGRGEAADLKEMQRRFGLIADVAAKTGDTFEEIQNTIQQGIQGRTGGLIRLLNQYYPDLFKRTSKEQIQYNLEMLSGPNAPELREREVYRLLTQSQTEAPSLKGMAEAMGEKMAAENAYARELEKATDYIATQVHAQMVKYYEVLTAGVQWFNNLNDAQKNAAIALGAFVTAVGAATAGMFALRILGRLAGVGGTAAGTAAGAAARVGTSLVTGMPTVRTPVPWLRGSLATAGIETAVTAGSQRVQELGGVGGNLDSVLTVARHGGKLLYPYGSPVEDRYTRERPWMLERAKALSGTGSWRGGNSHWWEGIFQGHPAAQGRQHGGPVSGGTPYMVGEAGPEMFTPVSSGLVSPMRGGSGRNPMARFNQSLAEATGSVNQFGSSLDLVSETLMKMWLEMKEAQASGSLGGGGMGGDEMGGVSGSTASSGNLAQNQQTAYNALRELGYDDQSAQIAVANFSGESLANPANKHWDVSHYSQGMVQWDDNRSAAIRAKFGKYPKDMTIAEQARAFDWEIKKDYPGAYSDLTNPSLSEEQRMYGLVKKYERPADPRGGAATRIRIKRGMKLQPWPGASGPAARERDPLNIPQQQSSLQLGRGQVDLNVKLDRQLAMSRPTTLPASNFDLGVNVDRTGTLFSRPGDPAFPPPLPYGVA